MPEKPSKSERIYVRVTPETKAKLEKLAAIRDQSTSDLMREKGVDNLVAEHDRMVAELSA